MNFDFSDDVTIMRGEVRRLLKERVQPGSVRAVAESGEPFDRDLWNEVASLGWLGVSLPEQYGGAGIEPEAGCMIAEEIGYAAAAIPFSSSVYLAMESINQFGSEKQKKDWLPRLVSGELIGAFALAEGNGAPSPAGIGAHFSRGALTGVKRPVWDGLIADLAIVTAVDEQGEAGLFLVEGDGFARAPLSTIEFGRGAATLTFAGARAEPLPLGTNWIAIERLLDRAAILFAFEAIGGAQGVLDIAVDYAKQRFAFGRPIGSMQAIKHMLADVYVGLELARSNAYFGAWALATENLALPLAASTARLAATDAYERASAQAIQVHGGMGFTQEVDCHIHYRRAKRLAVELGARRYWSDRLIAHLPETGA